MKSQLAILIVDDSQLIVSRLVRVLSALENPAIISNVCSYEEAMDALHATMPGIVLLDISLPGKSGIDVLRSIKEKNWQVEVIVLTNNVSESNRHLCKSLGAAYFLDKSNDFEKIPGIVSGIILN